MKTPDKKRLDEKVKDLGDLDAIVGSAKTVVSGADVPLAPTGAERPEVSVSARSGDAAGGSPIPGRRDDALDLRSIWSACVTNWRLLTIGFAATLAFAALMTLFVTPIYESTAVLLVRIGRESVYRPEVGDGKTVINRDREAAVHGEVEILRSRDLHERVAREMGVETLYPDLVPGEQPPDIVLARAVRRLESGLVVSPRPEASVIHVSFRHRSPDTSARVANVLVELFKDKHLETFSDSRSTAFLEDKVAEYRQRLEQAEQDLATFQLSNVVLSLEQEREILPAHRAELAAALKEARSEVAGLRARTEFRDDLHSQADGLTANPQQADSIGRAYARLLELRLQERELLGRFTESSRQVVNVREQIKLVEQSLDEMEERMKALRPPELVDDSAELLFQEARIKVLVSQLQQLDAELAGIPARQRRLRELSRERDLAEENYQTHLKRLEEVRILDAMDRQRIANISVIQEATVPLAPIRPRRGINLSVGAVLGIGVGLVLALAAGPRFKDRLAVGPIMFVTSIVAVAAVLAVVLLRPSAGAVSPRAAQTVASSDRSTGAAEPAAGAAETQAAAEIGVFLEDWAEAWSDQRVDDYLRCYAADFEVPGGLPRSDWERLRREKLSAPEFIEVSLTLLDSSESERGAEVTFRQTYESDRFSDVVTKTLALTKEAGEWKILRETTTP